MAPLKLAFAGLGLAFASPCAATTAPDWQPYVAEASLRFRVPIAWIERVIRVESGGQTMLGGHPIRSRAGAIGLMQLMPGTWEMMRSALSLGANPDDPHDNILAGTLYLRIMFSRFGYPGMFAAYNAGPGRFGAHLATGKGLLAETIGYLQKIRATGFSVPAAPRNRSSELLFALNRSTSQQPTEPPKAPTRSALFVVQNDVR
jgi:soluble lytic murein transglycosylase-like protein